MNPLSAEECEKSYNKIVKKAIEDVNKELFLGDEFLGQAGINIDSFGDIAAALKARDPYRIIKHTCDDSSFCAFAKSTSKARSITRQLLSKIGAFATDAQKNKLKGFKISDKKYGRHAALFRDTMMRQINQSERAQISKMRVVTDLDSSGSEGYVLGAKFWLAKFDPEKCDTLIKTSNGPPVNIYKARANCARFHSMSETSSEFKKLWKTWVDKTKIARRRLSARVSAQKKAAKVSKLKKAQTEESVGIISTDDLTWDNNLNEDSNIFTNNSFVSEFKTMIDNAIGGLEPSPTTVEPTVEKEMCGIELPDVIDVWDNQLPDLDSGEFDLV